MADRLRPTGQPAPTVLALWLSTFINGRWSAHLLILGSLSAKKLDDSGDAGSAPFLQDGLPPLRVEAQAALAQHVGS